MIITIDGPVASGKSLVAKIVSNKLGLVHLNSGLVYRAIAYILSNYNENSLDLREENIKSILNNIDYVYKGGVAKIIYDNRDLTPFLKSPDIDQQSSVLASIADVRNAVNEFLLNFSKKNSIIADGRDMGSVVFPNAHLKIYLTADENVRAERWRNDQLDKGRKYTFEQALKEVHQRDERDRTRKIAPLVVPEGAKIIDNTNLDINSTVDQILNFY